MANCSIILGKSGSGKSRSIMGLDPKTTIVINVLGKRLPFKGSNSVYNQEHNNLFRVNTYNEVIDLLDTISKKATSVHNVIIDDCIYIMRKEYFAKATETGYNKYVVLAQHFQQIISTIEGLRENLNVFLILHSEDITSDNVIVGYKVSTVGKLVDNQYSPVECVPIVLYADVQYDEKGNAKYGFYTHKFKNGVVEIPAKTPEGMFEEDFIPNDLGIVVKAMDEYYN